MMQERQWAVEEIENKQDKEQRSLENLVSQSASVWDEVQNAIALQQQSNLQVGQLLDLIQEGGKLLRPSQKLIKLVHLQLCVTCVCYCVNVVEHRGVWR